MPRIEECKRYIEECGYTFRYYNRPWYVFMSIWTHKDVAFTLHEIRHCFQYGW